MSTIEISAIICIVLLAYGLAFQWRRANELAGIFELAKQRRAASRAAAKRLRGNHEKPKV